MGSESAVLKKPLKKAVKKVVKNEVKPLFNQTIKWLEKLLTSKSASGEVKKDAKIIISGFGQNTKAKTQTFTGDLANSGKRLTKTERKAFEKRVEPPTEGMPLSEWPQITRTQAEELSFMNAKTVEQLASMKDSNLGAIMGGYALREKAQKWLNDMIMSGQIDKSHKKSTYKEIKELYNKFSNKE
jgi:hypothetical protein